MIRRIFHNYQAVDLAFLLAQIALLVLLLVSRFMHVDQFVNVDGCAHWFGRSLEFYKEISRGDFEGTLISGHPGVTVMILSGFSIIAAGYAKFQTLSLTPYFQELLFWAKVPVAVSTAFAVLLLVRVFRKNFGSTTLAVCIGVFLAIDPLFLGHSRFLQLDAMTSIAMLVSLVYLGLHVGSQSTRSLVASGVFAGLAMLTKSYAGALVPFAILALIFANVLSYRGAWIRNAAGQCAAWLLAAIAPFFLLWPAMWVAPVDTIAAVAESAGFAMTHLHENVGPGNGTDVALIGQAMQSDFVFDGGHITQLLGSYPVFPLLLALIPIVALFRPLNMSRRLRVLTIVLLAFAFFFAVGMSFLGKTGPRYMIAVCLVIDLLAAFGLVVLLRASKTFSSWHNFGERSVQLAAVGAISLTAVSVFSVHPYYATYKNNVIDANYMGWGEGLDLVADHFRSKPDVSELTIASFYPCILRKLGNCNAIQLDQIAAHRPDYVVLYKSQVERAMYPEVTATYLGNPSRAPEYVAIIGGVEYAWVYRANDEPAVSNGNVLAEAQPLTR